ncbi:hypothetical protein ASD55_14455 [Rhodanobacter sp. Root561]|nr:hypothetical protein ASD55_14455 [Rhodanobacter sp. Root561]
MVMIESIVDVFQLISVIGNHAHIEKGQRDNDDETTVDLLDFIHAQFLHFLYSFGFRQIALRISASNLIFIR